MSKSESGFPAVLFAAAAFAILAAGGSGAALAQDDRPFTIAVVDLDAVVANSPAGRALEQEIDAFQRSVQSEVDRRRDEARSLQQELREGAGTMTPARQAELRQSLERIMNDVRRYTDDQQREGQRRQSEGLRAIEQQLEPVFEQLQAEMGYDVILNMVPGVVVMAGGRADITDEVIRRLEASSGG